MIINRAVPEEGVINGDQGIVLALNRDWVRVRLTSGLNATLRYTVYEVCDVNGKQLGKIAKFEHCRNKK